MNAMILALAMAPICLPMGMVYFFTGLMFIAGISVVVVGILHTDLLITKNRQKSNTLLPMSDC